MLTRMRHSSAHSHLSHSLTLQADVAKDPSLKDQAHIVVDDNLGFSKVCCAALNLGQWCVNYCVKFSHLTELVEKASSERFASQTPCMRLSLMQSQHPYSAHGRFLVAALLSC